MTQVAARPVASVPRAGRAALVLSVGTLALAAAALWHLGQGAAGVGTLDVLRALLGDAADERVAAVTEGARVPRVLAGVIAGAALGLSGALLQSVTRNPLAAPDTLAVNAGAQLAVTATAVVGLGATGFGRLGVAFAGGALAAILVAVVVAGVAMTPARLILAGVAVTLLLSSITATLMLLSEQSTAGLFFWGQGSLAQTGLGGVSEAWPRLLVGVAGALLLARVLDVLALGEDAAAGLGVRVRRVQLASVTVAVLLSATAVALTGPIGFVGLAAPHIVRLLGVRRHLPVLIGAALWGAALLVAADAVGRSIRTPLSSEIAAGVVTALLGAPLFVWLARSVATRQGSAPTAQRAASARRPLPYPVLITLALGILAAGILAGILFGDLSLRPADLLAVLTGSAEELQRTVVVQFRLPRLTAAALAGAALAISGVLLQAVLRNPLAAPSLVGITGGATLGALAVLIALPSVPVVLVPAAAFGGALLTAAAVYGLAWRKGSSPEALVLVGVAVSAFAAAATNAIILAAEVRTAQALTWLSGSTYALTWDDVSTLAAWAVVLLPAAWLGARRLDLLGLGDELPRTLGMRIERNRALLVLLAVLLAAAAVSMVGAMAFVGLLAPHAARLLTGQRHHRLIPLAATLGAALVVVADTVGRTVIAPAQLPAGLVTALLGAPYFVWLLHRTRR